jgi:hypothetical protein
MMPFEPAGTRDIEGPPHPDIFATFVAETGASDPVLRQEGSSVTNAG